MADGYALAFGSIFQGGSYYNGSNEVMAVFRSTNDGESWDRYTLSTTDGAVYSIAVNPADANIVYAGGFYQTVTGRKAGMFRSINRGADWIEIGDAITASVIRFVGIDPNQTNRIYVGTDVGLFISADGGGSWEASTLNQWINCIVFDTAVPSRLFAGTPNGVYQSLDGGESWDEINNGLVNTDVQSMDFDAVNGILYAGTNGGGVFRYTVSTNVEEEIIRDAVPSNFALYQNFPNPFNAVTEIRYDLAKSGHVYLAVYDLKGRRVKTLVNSEQSAGAKTVKWNAVNDFGVESASGIYIIRLRTGNQVLSRKIILQK